MPVTFTYTFDVARYVVAALDLAAWPEESCVAGDTLTWNEFLALAEEARGELHFPKERELLPLARTDTDARVCVHAWIGGKFDVVYDDVEKLRRSEITELPGHAASYAFFPKPAFQWFMAIFERFTVDERISRVPPKLNARFPEIRPLTVRAMLEQCWRGK